MVRIGAIFIALCMVLIAASIGAVLYLRLGFSAPEAGLAALAILTVLALYNAVSGRRRDRAIINDQLASLARGSGDLARQLAEFSRRLAAMEDKSSGSAASGTNGKAAQPMAAEIEELSRLVRQLAESVAQHEQVLGAERTMPAYAGLLEKPGSTARAGDAASAAGAGGPA
jgi:cyclic-di-GMP phosphodiesterase, flagellum assembly factor TipF